MKFTNTKVSWKRGVYNTRPTKLATGMSKTACGQRRVDSMCMPPTPESRHAGDMLALRVRGTTDALRGVGFSARWDRKTICPCCQQPVPKLKLTDGGRARFRILLRKRMTDLLAKAFRSLPWQWTVEVVAAAARKAHEAHPEQVPAGLYQALIKVADSQP